jgi:lectin, mannose-binding 1
LGKFVTSAVENNDYRRPPPIPRRDRNEAPPANQDPPQTQDNSQASGQSGSSNDGSNLSQEQFNDLRNRLSIIDRQVNNIFRDLSDMRNVQDQRHQELMSLLNRNFEGLNNVDRTTNKINSMVLAVKNDVEGRDYQEHLRSLQDSLQETKAALSSHLPNTIKTSKSPDPSYRSVFHRLTVTLAVIKASVPSLGVFIFVVVAFQGVLAASYFMYKRRRANAPKKYL